MPKIDQIYKHNLCIYFHTYRNNFKIGPREPLPEKTAIIFLNVPKCHTTDGLKHTNNFGMKWGTASNFHNKNIRWIIIITVF